MPVQKPAIVSALPKARSGIRGLDEITGGGLPRGRPTLVCGSAGAGKTLFAIEFLVREAGDAIYVLACKKEGPTIRVRFIGLPAEIHGQGVGTVVFEEPRKVDAERGSFADWFGPFEVHVYQFRKK